LPQIVTQTPWFFCPPVLGPLSRSEKKMRGGMVDVRLDGADWARGPNETARIIPMMNKDANFMKGYLNTGRAKRDATADGTQEALATIVNCSLLETPGLSRGERGV
jgi:hypothetical protein